MNRLFLKPAAPRSLVRWQSTRPQIRANTELIKGVAVKGFDEEELKDVYVPVLERKRLIPTTHSFYARNAVHEDRVSRLNALVNKYMGLPFDKKNTSNLWLPFVSYQAIGGGNKLKTTDYERLVTLCRRLDSIDPQLKNKEIEEELQQYRKTVIDNNTREHRKTLDDKGRAVAIGRRKSASAKVYVVKGTGEILVNDKSIEEVFPRLTDRQQILYPLQVVDGEGKYNVFALTRSGGQTGQVDAVKLGIARALCIHNPLFKDRLFEAGCLTRDHRVVERKKPGKLKARKSPTWVKR